MNSAVHSGLQIILHIALYRAVHSAVHRIVQSVVHSALHSVVHSSKCCWNISQLMPKYSPCSFQVSFSGLHVISSGTLIVHYWCSGDALKTKPNWPRYGCVKTFHNMIWRPPILEEDDPSIWRTKFSFGRQPLHLDIDLSITNGTKDPRVEISHQSNCV